MKYRAILAFSFLCILTVVSSGQKLWERQYQKWNEEDAKKILVTSPWAKSYVSADAAAAADQAAIGASQSEQSLRRQTTLGPRGRSVPAPVLIRLHSGLPVRQAIIRLHQINAGYDKLDEAKRQAIDNQTRNLLDCPLCKDYYVVTLAKSTDSRGQGVDEGLFQSMTFEDLKGNVWLATDNGGKIELAQFTAPASASDTAVFFFKRNKENPYITPQTKQLSFVFNNTFFGSNNRFSGLLPRKFEFDVSKLVIGDKVEF